MAVTSVEAWVGNTCSFHLPIVGRSRRPGRNPGHRHGLRARSSTFRRPETPGIARAIGSEDGGAKVERRQKDEAPDLRSKIRGSRGSTDAPQRRHMWSIITWKSHLSPRRITLRPRWHPPSPVKGPSIGNPPTFIGGARCTFVTWPNTEQDRSQCSSKDPAGKPLAGNTPEDHRPAGKRSTSAGRLRGRLLFYTVLRLPASDWTKR